ncbi:MAG TPA: hypothetical protein VL754_05395 [Verrucomicrobiae bacterium]|jgi:DNA-directed RNA polymerase subunit RPC12/RpoP|nr:hypothetical protein [Verrucomicrobiae bacterium]
MPDRGIWTLRCQACQQDFTLELKPGQRLIDYARAYVCPHCRKQPEEVYGDQALDEWHHVIGFQAKTPSI